MPKKPVNNLIALETDKYEEKVREFQDYLVQNPIISTVTKSGELKENKDDQETRHREMLLQAKIMEVLPKWLLSLKELRKEEEEQNDDLRAGAEINDAAKLLNQRNK